LLELLSNVHPVSLARDEADVIVRAVRPTQGAQQDAEAPEAAVRTWP
jgi:hypothetical protein